MYKAISGNEGEWNDGVFSQAAPLQQYQASLREFENGALGALTKRPDPRFVRRGRYVSVRRPMQGMGKTFLPAFTREEMRGLGHAYQDGVLGADSTTASPSISIPAVTITEGSQPAPAWKFDLTSMFIGMAAGFITCKLLK